MTIKMLKSKRNLVASLSIIIAYVGWFFLRNHIKAVRVASVASTSKKKVPMAHSSIFSQT